MINNEITTQVIRKLDETREDLKTEILEVINSAMAETALLSIQNVLGVQKWGLNTMRDHQSGRLDRSPEDHSSDTDHRSAGLKESPRGHSDRMDHRSRGLDEDPKDYSGQMDHLSGRQNENLGGQFSQVDHRSTGLDRSPLGRFGQQDQQDRRKINPKFSSHVGLNW